MGVEVFKVGSCFNYWDSVMNHRESYSCRWNSCSIMKFAYNQKSPIKSDFSNDPVGIMNG